MIRLRILGLSAGLLFLLLAVGCEPRQPLPDEDQLFESLMEEYVLARFRFYPVESTLAGLPGNDARLGNFSPADVSRRIAALSDFHKKLMGLKPDALSQPAYLDSLWLKSLVKMELFELEDRRLLERSASFYAETIRTGVVALLLSPDIGSRTDALAGRLDAIPPLLEQARENLEESPPGLLARDGVDRLATCSQLLADMPLLLEERAPSYRVAELAERSRLAARAVQQLEAHLSAKLPRGRTSEIAPLGPEGLERFFLYREMVDWEPERLVSEAEQAVAAATDRMTELALERFPDKSLTALLASSEPAGSLEEAISTSAERALAFLRASAGEEAPAGSLPIVVVPPYFLGSEIVRLWRPAALLPAKEAALLVSGSARAISAKELDLLALGELAGRYRLFVRQSESPSLLRRVTRARTSSEAWVSWFVSRALEGGYQTEDRELELRHLHQGLVDALRLSVGARVHAFELGLATAEKEFRERGFLSPARARLEAEAVALDPGVGSVALGRILLEELAHDYRSANPLIAPTELERQLLSESLVPLRLARFKLLGLSS